MRHVWRIPGYWKPIESLGGLRSGWSRVALPLVLHGMGKPVELLVQERFVVGRSISAISTHIDLGIITLA
jgi:hypothetical protein